MTTYPGLLREVDDGLLWLRLDRQPRHLLEPGLMRALVASLTDADADATVSAIVLTGTGAVFCGGLDVEALRAGGDPVEFARELVALLRIIPKLGKPVLGAVNGDALASGFSLACACDYTVAVEGSKLGTYEASIGIWPMIAQVPPLQRLLPRHALQNVMTGVPFDAAEAQRIGAVNAVVAAGELAATIGRFAALATGSGSALAAGRRTFYQLLDLSYDAALDAALDEFTQMFAGASAS
jgi:enoyl-CoA hydratase/carnithine racemase